MYPIFEQGRGKGIGLSFDRFINKFIDICSDHLNSGKAKAFALIIYNFGNKQIKNVLKSQGGFAKLDRLSGDDLSIFYLNSSNRELMNYFNEVFLRAFDIENKNALPFVLFFKVVDKEVADIKIVELEQSDLRFAFLELYSTIENYIIHNAKLDIPKTNKLTSYINQTGRITVEKLIEWIVDKGLGFLGEIH